MVVLAEPTPIYRESQRKFKSFSQNLKAGLWAIRPLVSSPARRGALFNNTTGA